MVFLNELPDDLSLQIVHFLDGKSVFQCSSVNKKWHALQKDAKFWEDLMTRDGGDAAAAATKQHYQTYCHASSLTQVKWSAIEDSGSQSPSPREGHLMCTLGNYVLNTGGFCDDDCIHYFDITTTTSSSTTKNWTVTSPYGETPCFVYGASFTPIDDKRVVRFGGFTAGGYSGETDTVAVLHFHQGVAQWERIVPTLPNDAKIRSQIPRAYHSATLIHGRYLVVLGGMRTSHSTMAEAILDTVTWEWLESTPIVRPHRPRPLPRHGHSVVLDEIRNRLVLFGGGDGSDLLRSGDDNTEVWELKFGDKWDTHNLNLPWEWNLLHRDAPEYHDTDVDDDDSTISDSAALSPAESLCVGRCHIGLKVARDSVLLCFGSGRPSTNGVLGYSLHKDQFVRPSVKGSYFPVPRFTAAGCVLQNWVVVHGGYCTQSGGTLMESVVLDLAPSMKREFPALKVHSYRQTYPQISDEHIEEQRTMERLSNEQLRARLFAYYHHNEDEEEEDDDYDEDYDDEEDA